MGSTTHQVHLRLSRAEGAVSAPLSRVPPPCIQEEAATVSDPNLNDAIESAESVEDQLDIVEAADAETRTRSKLPTSPLVSPPRRPPSRSRPTAGTTSTTPRTRPSRPRSRPRKPSRSRSTRSPLCVTSSRGLPGEWYVIHTYAGCDEAREGEPGAARRLAERRATSSTRPRCPRKRSSRSRTASARTSGRTSCPADVLVRMDLTNESGASSATRRASPASWATPTTRTR